MHEELGGVVISKTPNFKEPPLFEAVGCLCLFQDKILLLKRTSDRSYPNVWGLPSGKVEREETRDRAMIRELYEETGLLRSVGNLSHLDDFHIRNEEFTFLYAMFATQFSTEPLVKVNRHEHSSYKWASYDDAMTLPLVPGTHECLAAVRSQVFRPVQLPLFSVDENVLSDAIYAEQEQLEAELGLGSESGSRKEGASPVVIFGPPAAGKTTLIRGITQQRPDFLYNGYDVMKDRTSRQYTYLTRYLGGDRSYAFPCQIEALASRYWHARSVELPNTLIDEWIFSTLAYARALRYQGDLQDNEFQTFYMTYLAYLQWLQPPKLVIYVTAQPDTLRSRVKARGRKLEQTSHDLAYLTMLKQAFDEVAEEVGTKNRLALIDTTDMSRQTAVQKALELLNEYNLGSA